MKNTKLVNVVAAMSLAVLLQGAPIVNYSIATVNAAEEALSANETKAHALFDSKFQAYVDAGDMDGLGALIVECVSISKTGYDKMLKYGASLVEVSDSGMAAALRSGMGATNKSTLMARLKGDSRTIVDNQAINKVTNEDGSVTKEYKSSFLTTYDGGLTIRENKFGADESRFMASDTKVGAQGTGNSKESAVQNLKDNAEKAKIKLRCVFSVFEGGATGTTTGQTTTTTTTTPETTAASKAINTDNNVSCVFSKPVANENSPTTTTTKKALDDSAYDRAFNPPGGNFQYFVSKYRSQLAELDGGIYDVSNRAAIEKEFNKRLKANSGSSEQTATTTTQTKTVTPVSQTKTVTPTSSSRIDDSTASTSTTSSDVKTPAELRKYFPVPKGKIGALAVKNGNVIFVCVTGANLTWNNDKQDWE